MNCWQRMDFMQICITVSLPDKQAKTGICISEQKFEKESHLVSCILI